MSDDDSHSDEIVYLHGDLDLMIIEARNLPNMDLVSDHVRRCFTAFDSCRKPCQKDDQKVRTHRKYITSDPYISVCLAGATVARTRVISNSQNPKWNERFKIQLAHPVSQVEFQVKDNEVFGADLIGTATISADRIKSGKAISDWFPILSLNRKPFKRDAAIRMEMIFFPCDENPLYNCFIADLDKHGVQHSYFPVRRGGSLTLYQDAHVKDGSLPEIKLENGADFRHEKCWEDICHSILEAHHLIYICGWSIYHKVKLVREPTKPLPDGGDLSLGDLLKYKSQEGVRVLLLVWDDFTSHNKFFIKTTGVMQTHDEETRKFFKHSSVVCVLSPRYASSKLSFFKQKVVGTLYTHHQKCVIVDTQARGNFRKITSFIGGLDLCDGRYDTPDHRLFRDLDTVFKDDYHNPTFPAGLKGPRQPWHDLHCKIEGPAAYDVLTNFEQRWRKTTKWHEDALIKLERISWILSPSASISYDHPLLWASKEDDPETWHVQVFRSIDSGSLKGFPNKVHTAEAQNLVCAKNLVVDKSIQTAYIKAIRSAQRFIYIENQYFIGSSFAWPSYKDAGADNLVPIELALKIASKIRANERFAVYIVIPMWPEGVPSGVACQQILYWQGQTMQMMYKIISQELQSKDLENSDPQDYLNFYCLGNREELPPDVSCNSGPVLASRKFQRFMIYVHSKGMIIDDEYVIIGSANINQRSMSGSRDTEIAMGAYQPYHTWAKKKAHPRAQIYGYRMSLWAEHVGMMEDCFNEPNSLECVKRINEIAEDNWDRYTSDEHTPLQGHLLKYPIEVDINGKVNPLLGHETFPDVGGKVLGSLTSLPDVLTT